jgi:hypothetical protein
VAESPKTKADMVKLLKRSVAKWNAWRKQHPDILPDLSEADLCEANLCNAELSGVDLHGARLLFANLLCAQLDRANLVEAKLIGANLRGANVRWANLAGVDLRNADIVADLRGTDLRRANLCQAALSGTNFEDANLTGCRIYGISAWDLKLDGAVQDGLIITPEGQPEVTVGDLEVAQFIYLLLFNRKIQGVVDSITSKVVLILGRFTEERKTVLDAMRDTLRHRDLIPIIFDFDKPSSKDVTGTVETLARMARFIIADLTDPSSVPHELATLVPYMRTTPVATIRLKGSGGYSVWDDYERSYDKWVLPKFEYDSAESLIKNLDKKVIGPARARADKLQGRKPPSASHSAHVAAQ